MVDFIIVYEIKFQDKMDNAKHYTNNINNEYLSNTVVI